MAWSYRSKRTYSRSARRSFRRRRLARPRYRRRYRRSGRGRKTTSALVKLTVEVHWNIGGPLDGGQPTYHPFSFTPLDLPGFADYQLTYSQFRILKCRLQLGLNSARKDIVGNNDNFLVAPSRPVARNMGPIALGENASTKFVPPSKRRSCARPDGRRSSIQAR